MAQAVPQAGFFAPVQARVVAPGFTLSVLRQKRELRLPAHGHARAYFSFLVSGSYEERVGASQLEHRPPFLVFHPAGTEHRDAYGAGGGEFLSIELAPDWLAPWTESGSSGGDPIVVTGDHELRAARALWHGVSTRADICGLWLEQQVLDLVAAAARIGRGQELRRPGWLKGVVEALSDGYVDPPGIGTLARQAGVHPAHLSRAFRRHVGCTPTALVQRRRVEHVWRRLLVAGAPTLAELAVEAGFCDQSHCTRVFKRIAGVPPGAFRGQTVKYQMRSANCPTVSPRGRI